MIIRTFSHHSHVPDRFAIEGPLYVGGEGEIYFSRCGRFVIKLYHDRLNSPERENFLKKVLFLGRNLGEDLKYLCWPQALVEELDGVRKIGVITERIPRPPFRELVDYIFSPREFKRAVEEGIHWLNYLRVAHSLARLVSVLHGRGCAHADLHFNNFLVDMRSGRAVMIDLDGLVIPGFLPPQVLGMIPFMAPEIISRKSSPDQGSDRHSLAVLVFQTLLLRNPLQPLTCFQSDDAEQDELIGWGREAVFSENPYNFRNRPKRLGYPLYQQGVLSVNILPPEVRALFEQCFIQGLFHPNRRPLAREWEMTLNQTFFSVWPCRCCEQHFPYPVWISSGTRRCPFCGKALLPPFPVVLRVYHAKTAEVSVVRPGCLVLGHRYRVIEKMLKNDGSRLSYGEVRLQAGRYHFIPDLPVSVLPPGESGNRRRYREGEGLELLRGMLIEFGENWFEVIEDGL